MDPNETYRLYKRAVRNRDREEAAEYGGYLRGWLRAGGFEPRWSESERKVFLSGRGRLRARRRKGAARRKSSSSGGSSNVMVTVGRSAPVRAEWTSPSKKVAVVKSFHNPPQYIVFDGRYMVGASRWFKAAEPASFSTLPPAIRRAKEIES